MCQAPGPALCTFPQNLRPQTLSVAASWRRGPRPRGQVCRAPGDVYLRGLWMCAGTLGPRRVCACISAVPRGPAQKTPAQRCAHAWSRGEGRGRAARGQRPGKSGPWGRQRLRGRRGEQEAGWPPGVGAGLGVGTWVGFAHLLMGDLGESPRADGCSLEASDRLGGRYPARTPLRPAPGLCLCRGGQDAGCGGQRLTTPLGLCLQVPSETWRPEKRPRPRTPASRSERPQPWSPSPRALPVQVSRAVDVAGWALASWHPSPCPHPGCDFTGASSH